MNHQFFYCCLHVVMKYSNYRCEAIASISIRAQNWYIIVSGLKNSHWFFIFILCVIWIWEITLLYCTWGLVTQIYKHFCRTNFCTTNLELLLKGEKERRERKSSATTCECIYIVSYEWRAQSWLWATLELNYWRLSVKLTFLG